MPTSNEQCPTSDQSEGAEPIRFLVDTRDADPPECWRRRPACEQPPPGQTSVRRQPIFPTRSPSRSQWHRISPAAASRHWRRLDSVIAESDTKPSGASLTSCQSTKFGKQYVENTVERGKLKYGKPSHRDERS